MADAAPVAEPVAERVLVPVRVAAPDAVRDTVPVPEGATVLVDVDEEVRVAAGLLVEDGEPATEGTATVIRRMRLLSTSAM